jgi:hypothetical protein
MIGGGSTKPAPVKTDDSGMVFQTSGDFKPAETENNGSDSPERKQAGNKNSNFSPILVCTILTVWMIVGILLGIVMHSVLLMTCFLLPVVGYEAYRTKGELTTFASWALLIVLILEIIFLAFGINYDLGKYLDLQNIYVAGQDVPLGDIKILGPTLMAVLSLILIFRTAGPYTKWLSVIIIITALIMVNMMNPLIFKELLRGGVQRLMWYF